MRAAMVLWLVPVAVYGAEPRSPEDAWPASWKRIGPVETAAIGGLGLGALLLEVVVKAPSNARWDSPILFDDSARNALRAGSATGRSRAATASDFGYLGLPIYAVGVEAGLVTWLGKDKADVALQLGLINVEAIAINALLSRVTQTTVGRSRPDAQPGNSDNTAFFSGHTSTAFTSASALCGSRFAKRMPNSPPRPCSCVHTTSPQTSTCDERPTSKRHESGCPISGK